MAEAVRRPRETEATHLQSGRLRAIEQEASHLQEELSAGFDRGSVHGDAGEARRLPMYKIAEWDDTPVRGTFYAHDLKKVSVGNDDLFRVDRIVKRGKDKVLVHWKGWPDKYDSWVRKGDVTTEP